MRKYTPEMHKWLAENQEGKFSPDLAQEFNEHFGVDWMTAAAVKRYRHNNHLNSGLTGKFQKGQPSWNRGMKIPKERQAVKTQFKKGNIPHNHRPIGYVRIDSKDGIAWVKVKDNYPADHTNFVQRSRLVWEEHNGEIPKGMCVFHLNGDPLDDRIENLTLLSRSELRYANQMYKFCKDPEINKTIIAAVKLDLARMEKEKKK